MFLSLVFKKGTHYNGECNSRKNIKGFLWVGVWDVQNAVISYLTSLFCGHQVKPSIGKYEELQLYRTSGSHRYSLGKSCFDHVLGGLNILAPKAKHLMFVILFLRYDGITILSNLTFREIGNLVINSENVNYSVTDEKLKICSTACW